MTKTAKTAQQEALVRLHEMIKPGDTVHTILRHVSRSGMNRSISAVIQSKDGLYDIDYWVGRATDRKIDPNHGGLKIGGCGMDMGFELVYTLSDTMWPNGFECTGKNCPSNDHTNGDRNYEPHHHRSGGYALKQRWL